MSYWITRAPRAGNAPFPSSEARFVWAVRLPGHRIGWSNSVAGLVGAVVGEPGYAEMTLQDQAYHRIMRAVGFQVVTQARINLIAQSEGGDWDSACEWERDVLNGPRHSQPHGFDSAPVFGGRDVWSCPIPLVLVRTGYRPFSDIEPIEGSESGTGTESVWWIDPSTNDSFLSSLGGPPLGLIEVWRPEQDE